jgi:hypothetical protein
MLDALSYFPVPSLKIYTIATGGSSSQCAIFYVACEIAVIALLAPNAKKVA